jgi:hypothetical protein
MRRTRMLVAAAVVALSMSASGTGAALAQSHDDDHGNDDPELAERCHSYNIIEWLLFHHECHGHLTGEPLWPTFW